MAGERLSAAIEREAVPLAAGERVVELARGARFALLGEATHGTHEFYGQRAELTKRLLDEAGFDAVAAEADWPDAYRVNCYVRGASGDGSADEALGDFRRFPAWMWRNEVVRAFVEWLRERNDAGGPGRPPAGFYGLDLYSLTASVEAVLAYLDGVDPEAAARARVRYGCFEDAGGDPHRYGVEAAARIDDCEDAVVEQLLELRRVAANVAAADGRVAEDRHFHAEQNARLVRSAEAYYRALYRGRESSWNLRDRHMADSLDALAAHLGRDGGPARIVVWAHNSHVGDARATEMGRRGELNLGQLVRERHPGETVVVGFTTFDGTVTASSRWGGDPERKRVQPGLPESWEALLHELGPEPSLLSLAGAAELTEPRLQRAIGVVYRPERERLSHYFEARLADQFDALVHVDRTRAVEPLEPTSVWQAGETETYPHGV